jgi:DNA-binding transcriptional LysR family regulator
MRLRIAFDEMPTARWGTLFHVLCLEHPAAALEFTPVAFPTRGSSRLEGVDVGLFVNPPRGTDLERLVLEESPMVVLMAAGHRLAREHDELRVADLLDEPFLAGPPLDPAWTAFWTLDDFRQGPPKLSGGGVRGTREGLDAVAAGQAVATCPESMAAGLSHPGVVALPLVDGPLVETALVWRAGKRHPLVDTLIDLAAAMTSRDPASTPKTGPPRTRPEGVRSGLAESARIVQRAPEVDNS